MWKPIDAIAGLLLRKLTVGVQMRIGVISCLLALPLILIGFTLDEPIFIYQLSVGALLITGINIVVAAAPSEEDDE